MSDVAELQRRLVYSLLRPVARMSRRFRLPLKTLEELCRLAYFEAVRRQGDVPQAEVARIFGRSLRTVGILERQFRANFLAPVDEVEFTRRVEGALDSGPRSAADVATELDAPADRVLSVLEGLVGTARVTRAPDGRFTVDRRYVSLVTDDPAARIDGLNHQLDVLAAAVVTRFLEPDRTSIGRTLSFVATPEVVEALAATLARELRARCGEAEEASLEAGDYARYGVTFALAPLDE